MATPRGDPTEPLGDAASAAESRLPVEKKRFCASEQGRPDVQVRRADFIATMKDVDPERLIFIDESGCNRSMALLYGRAVGGARVYDQKPAHWGQNLSVIGAIRADRVLCHQTVPGSINGPRFVTFVRDRLCPRIYPGDIVVLDNLRPHHAPAVRQLIEAQGAQLVFLPPYSPDLNPIEPCWSFVKHQLRKLGHRTVDKLKAGIRNAFLRVRSTHLANWFTHCGYNQGKRSPV